MFGNEYKYSGFALTNNFSKKFWCGFGSLRIIILERSDLHFILKQQ